MLTILLRGTFSATSLSTSRPSNDFDRPSMRTATSGDRVVGAAPSAVASVVGLLAGPVMRGLLFEGEIRKVI